MKFSRKWRAVLNIVFIFVSFYLIFLKNVKTFWYDLAVTTVLCLPGKKNSCFASRAQGSPWAVERSPRVQEITFLCRIWALQCSQDVTIVSRRRGSLTHFPDLQSFHVCLVWCYLRSYARRFPKRSLRLKHLGLSCARIDHFAKMRCVCFVYFVHVVLVYGIS